jgi:hypothetical protein
MDAYGLAILGNVTVENDNTYVWGGASNRMANIYSVYFTGIAISSQYADLAEKYSCDDESLPIGTVISVSRHPDFEVCKCPVQLDPAYVGVVSENPGYIMGDRDGGLVTGLVGKLPVLIKGGIEQGEFIVPMSGGYARRGGPGEESFKMGVSLETNNESECKLVMCIIK